MKCQIGFLFCGGGGGDKKNMINLSSPELSMRVVRVRREWLG